MKEASTERSPFHATTSCSIFTQEVLQFLKKVVQIYCKINFTSNTNLQEEVHAY